MKYTFHPHARKELSEAVAYYGTADPESGESFLKEISKSIARIVTYPEAWSKVRGEIRRCRLDRSPTE